MGVSAMIGNAAQRLGATTSVRIAAAQSSKPGKSRPLRAAVNVSFVVPCYNEQANIGPLLEALEGLWLKSCAAHPQLRTCEIVLIDDGSTDATWDLIADAAATRQDIVGIRLSRNFGHQPALLAGLMTATGDAVISLDADLQDDISVIPDMLAAFLRGDEIVFGVRKDRSTDTAFKRITAQCYYRLLAGLGVDVLHDHADFRLMGRKSIEALRQHGEQNLYLRGLIRSLGFRSSVVSYARQARSRGESGYTLRRMLLLALEGITSFSVRPLRWIFYLGMIMSVLAGAYILYAVGMALSGATVSGWASLVVSIYLIGGIQIMGIGILGEYLGKTYVETKRRPSYLIDEVVSHADA